MNRKLRTAELDRLTKDAFQEAKKTPIVIVLENIRSLNNVGSIFRTADAFLLEGIHLCSYTARPPHREIRKTALGATESVHWEAHENGTEAVEALKAEGYRILPIEHAEHTTPLDVFTPAPDDKLAVVLGNEVDGVSQEILDTTEDCIEVPQFGTKHSLNVSVCTGIVVWDLFTKLRRGG